MSKPEPLPVPSEKELLQLAEETIQAAKFPHLATMDGDQPRVRPVSPVRREGFVIYMANLRSYHKTQELAANPRLELCYLAPNHDQVRITGTAETVTEKALLENIWEGAPLLRQYLHRPDNPELIIYKIVPNAVRFMREWALEYHDVPMGN